MHRKNEDDDRDDFRKRREDYSINIRKLNREEIFNKRRNMGSDPAEQVDQVDPNEGENQVVDERYREQIVEMINFQYDLSMFNDLCKLVYSADVLEIHRGVIGLRKLLATDYNPPTQEFIDAGLINKFFEFINQKQFPQLKLEAIWTLTNVASGPTEHCTIIVDKGGMDLFIRLLQENQKGIVDQAIWAIGNISADQVGYRDRLIIAGVVPALINVVENATSKTLVKNGTWTISNLCRGNPPPKYELIKCAIPTLAKAIQSGVIKSKEIISDCTWALSYMSEGPKSRIQLVMQTGVTPTLIKNCLDSYSGIYLPSLRTIGNFSAGNEVHVEQMFQAGVLEMLRKLLQHPKATIRREAVWILSNLAAGTASHAETISADQDIMRKIVHIFQADVIDVKRQVCWVLSNLGYLGPRKKILEMYIQYDIMRHFVNILSVDDVITLDTALECLYKLLLIGMKAAENNKNLMLKQLTECNGAERIQELQHHKSIKIYQKAVKILTKFFVVDEGAEFI